MNGKKLVSSVLSIFLSVMCIPFMASADSEVLGDANGDGKLSIRDSAYIANSLSKGNPLSLIADFNQDGISNIRDASAIANSLTSSYEVCSYEAYAVEILDLVNAERARLGISPLKLDLSVNNAANIRAEEISTVFSHNRPDGSSFSTTLNDLGINYYYCGENIAAGLTSPSAVVERWINSPAHYENIINEAYTQLGVGYYYDENSVYKHHWVQIFKCG